MEKTRKIPQKKKTKKSIIQIRIIIIFPAIKNQENIIQNNVCFYFSFLLAVFTIYFIKNKNTTENEIKKQE